MIDLTEKLMTNDAKYWDDQYLLLLLLLLLSSLLLVSFLT